MTTGLQSFHGWRVVGAAFVLATFGWGLGFYGPPIYLHAVREARGWSVALVSAAVTVHYLFGALIVANLPGLHRRFGLRAVTRVGALALALGLVGWASASEPWQLFAATLFTGGGWVTMGAAAINAIVSPWFVAGRPKALSTAYNGASVGGILFSPLWVALITALGFPVAALLVGGFTIAVVMILTGTILAHTPASLGQEPDGQDSHRQDSSGQDSSGRDSRGPAPAGAVLAAPAGMAAAPPALPGKALWRDRRFRTLAGGMALGLFAQIGLLAHLFSLIVPALGPQWAGITMGLATASAIAGRTAFGWLMPAGADRRVVACFSYGLQIIGCLVLVRSGTDHVALVLAGVLLFGFGIGNATSLPPLIAQSEFAREDTPRVVALIVAMGQATYAFAPALFGLLRELPALAQGLGLPGSLLVFLGAATIKALAFAVFLAGRRRA